MGNLCEGTAPFLSIFPIDRFRASPRFPDRRFVGFGDAAWFILSQFFRLFRFRGSAETRPRGGSRRVRESEREGGRAREPRFDRFGDWILVVVFVGFPLGRHSFSQFHAFDSERVKGWICVL